MGFNFPYPAVTGQVFTPPGGPTYRYDSPAWVAVGGTDAPDPNPDMSPFYSIRRWLTQAQWDAVVTSTYGQSLSVELQRAEDEVSAAGGGTITYPAGLFPVDGYKGSQPSFNSSRRGGLYVKGGVYHKGVPGKTIWKNVADNWRCLVAVREGSDFGFEGIVFDGDWPNRPTIPATTDSIRGEGIIFFTSVVNGSVRRRIIIRDCIIKNTGHYAIGIQNPAVDTLLIENCRGENCGGDFIDIKDYPVDAVNNLGPKTNIHIIGNVADRIGVNWQGRDTDGDGPQAAFDIRGLCVVSNNTVVNLDSYNAVQLGNDGFRVNSPVSTNSGRLGGNRSILTGNRVISSKLDNEGSGSVKRIRGLVVADDRISVFGHHNSNCYIGTVVYSAGTGTCDYTQLHGIYNENCHGEAGGGMGAQLTSGSFGHKIDVVNEKCDIGFVCSAQGSFGRVANIDCALGHSLTANALALNNFQFYAKGNTSDANIGNSTNNFRTELSVWASQNPRLNLQSSIDGTWTAPYQGGGIDWYKQDVSSFGAGRTASLEWRAGSNLGGSGALWFSIQTATNVLSDVVTISSTAITMLRPLVLASANVPVSAVAPGVAGQTAYDSGFVYVCTAANTWKRAALVTW